MKAFQIESPTGSMLAIDFDGELDPAVDQDLPVGRLRAEPGAEIRPPFPIAV